MAAVTKMVDSAVLSPVVTVVVELQRTTDHCAGSSVAVPAVAVKVAKVVLASTLAAVAVVTVAVDSVVPAAVLVAVSMNTVAKDCVVLVTVLVPVAAVTARSRQCRAGLCAGGSGRISQLSQQGPQRAPRKKNKARSPESSFRQQNPSHSVGDDIKE